jgi:hypothetical protein
MAFKNAPQMGKCESAMYETTNTLGPLKPNCLKF